MNNRQRATPLYFLLPPSLPLLLRVGLFKLSFGSDAGLDVAFDAISAKWRRPRGLHRQELHRLVERSAR